MTVEDFLASHPYSANTKDTYRTVLGELERLDIAGLTPASLLAFIERPTWGGSRRYVALCACKKYLRWLHGDQHPALATKIKRGKSKRQRALDPQQAIKLLSHFNTQEIKGVRDCAIAMLAMDTALRVSELASIEIKNIDFNPVVLPGVSIPVCTLDVIVKGGDWGTAIFSLDTAVQLENWLGWRGKQSNDNLFTNVFTGEPLTVDGLKVTVKRWGEACGFKLSIHDFRRSFATLVTRNGAPSRTGQKAGRWNRIEMFEHYTATLEQIAIAPYLPVPKLLNGK